MTILLRTLLIVLCLVALAGCKQASSSQPDPYDIYNEPDL